MEISKIISLLRKKYPNNDVGMFIYAVDKSPRIHTTLYTAPTEDANLVPRLRFHISIDGIDRLSDETLQGLLKDDDGVDQRQDDRKNKLDEVLKSIEADADNYLKEILKNE